MSTIPVPLVGIAAYSGTGKTTLLTRLITLFKKQGLRIGIIKHAHHTFEIDYPGKDSYELRKAGAKQVLIGSRKRWALLVDTEDKTPDTLQDHVNRLDPDSLDLILVEGFKPETIPKIELYRPSLNKPLLYPQDDTIIAVATDDEQELATSLPVLDLNKPEQIAQFIIDRFLTDHQNIAIADK